MWTRVLVAIENHEGKIVIGGILTAGFLAEAGELTMTAVLIWLIIGVTVVTVVSIITVALVKTNEDSKEVTRLNRAIVDERMDWRAEEERMRRENNVLRAEREHHQKRADTLERTLIEKLG